jgi:hypothetical protein
MGVEKRREPQSSEVTLGAPEAELLGEARQRESRRGSGHAIQLHICPECDSQLVYPIDWAPAATRHWHVELRCPDCEWHGDGIYGQDVVDRFDAVLDDGTEAVLDDLTRLTHANMEEEIDRFADALSRDLILPEDF